MAEPHIHDVSRVAGYRSRVGVCPHETAAPEEYPSEVACHDDTHICQTALFQHIEHRYAARALRLAVVGVSGNIVLADYVGIDIVSCLAVLSLYGVHKLHRLVIISDGSDMPDKFRALFDKRSLCRFRDC